MFDRETHEGKLRALAGLIKIGAMAPQHPMYAAFVDLSKWIADNPPPDATEED